MTTTTAKSSAGVGIPSRFEIILSRTPGLTYPLAYLTRLGRAKNRLAAVKRAGATYSSRAALSRSIAILRRKPLPRGREQESGRLIEEMLCVLTVTSARSGALVEAVQWLAMLEEIVPGSRQLMPITWELLEHFHSNTNCLDSYACLAHKFLSHQQAPEFKPAVVIILKYAYKNLSKEQQLVAVQSINGQLLADYFIEQLVWLCQCPEVFGSSEEARRWASTIDPDAFQSEPDMHSEALLIRVKTAEWERRWGEMLKGAELVHQRFPNDALGWQWLLRALLRNKNSRLPEEVFNGARLPDWTRSLEVSRLRRLYQIRTHRTLSEIEWVIDELEKPDIADDAMQLSLALDVIETALNDLAGESVEKLAFCEKICLRLQSIVECIKDQIVYVKRVCPGCRTTLEIPVVDSASYFCPQCRRTVPMGPTPLGVNGLLLWTELIVVRSLILIKRDYRRAFEQATPFGNADARMQDLSRISGILLGKPQRLASSGRDGLSVIELAMRRWFEGGTRESRDDFVTIQNELGKAELPEAFPALAVVRGALQLTAEVFANQASAKNGNLEFVPDASAPEWIRWLRTRLVTLGCEASLAIGMIEESPALGFADCWHLEGWLTRQSSAPGSFEAVLKEVRQCLDNLSEVLPKKFAMKAQALRAWRANSSNFGGLLNPIANGDLTGAPEIPFAASWRDEFNHEADCARARLLLRQGEAQLAIARLSTALQRTNSQSALVRAEWEPEIKYWLAVAMAHAGDPSAKICFQEIQATARGADSLVQLALVNLRERNPAGAAALLENVPNHIPSAYYARALLKAMEGAIDESIELLKKYSTQFGEIDSVYKSAGVRLLTSLQERRSDKLEAQGTVEGPDQWTTDPAACLGQSKRSLRRLYARNRSLGLEADALEIQLDLAERRLPKGAQARIRSYRELLRFLCCPDDQLEQLGKELKTPASLQLYLRRLVERGCAQKAAHLATEAPTAAMPDYLKQSIALLRAWNCLASVHEDPPTALQRIDDAHALLAGVQDAESLWCTKYTRLLEAARTAARDGLVSMPEIPSELKAEPIWQIIRIWSEDKPNREIAATRLRSVINTRNHSWSAPQILALRIMVAAAVNDHEWLIENYRESIASISETPLSLEGFWLAVAQAWMERREWTHLTPEALPKELAEMESPEVRLTVVCALGQAAADGAVQSGHESLERITRARRILEEMRR